MVRENEIRKAEVALTSEPAPTDAGLVFIGRIHTPRTSRMETPRQGRADGPLCRIEVFEPWVPGLADLHQYERIEVLYWLHLSRRDLVLQSPANDGTTRGTFSLRIAGAAEPDRNGDCATRSDRGRNRDGAGARLPGRDAATRPQAGPHTLHPDRTATTWRFSNWRSLTYCVRLRGFGEVSITRGQRCRTRDRWS
jgi:hypothetical protein